jgi:flagellar hook-length control protein FliK
MGMDEDTADTLYTLGNNTYNYLDAQSEVVKNYINSKLEVNNADSTTNTAMETGVMENRVSELKGTMKDALETNEMPIVSASYQKTSASETVIQPSLGVTVPNMIQQKMIRADMSALSGEAENSNSQKSENGDFGAQLSEIATANANVNVITPQFELPKVQNLSNPLFDEFNVSEQITDGVKANLNLEKSEFTVKLNPESLGEVTIKLAEEGGKMVVNITAATESTAKLLNSDLTALRDSLGSLNLEIREVTVEAPESIEESMAQFNMTSQQFSDRQRAFNNQQQDDTPYYAHSDGAYMSEEITADYSGRVRTAVDGLDTYV